MATLRLTIIPERKLKSGKHRIRVAVSHKQQTLYIVTRFEIDSVEQFKDGQIVSRPDAVMMNRKLLTLLNEYYAILDSINPDLLSCSELKKYLENNLKKGGVSISQAADEKITTLKKSSVSLYTYTKKYFIEEFGDLPLGMISPNTVDDFEKHLFSKGMSSTTVSIHQRQLKSFITPQIKKNTVEFKIHPFAFYKMPQSEDRELDVTPEEFKLIRDSQFKEKPLRMARDLFCLSYYLGGINLIDLLEIDFRKATTVDYIREKTKNTKRGEKRISLTIQPEAKEITDKWIGRNGKLDFGYSYSYDNFRNYLTKQIKRLVEKLGINKRVVYYSARKSLVQHGFELGISLEILEYSIGQSVKKNRPIFNYVRIMRNHADAAIRTILDNLK